MFFLVYTPKKLSIPVYLIIFLRICNWIFDDLRAFSSFLVKSDLNTTLIQRKSWDIDTEKEYIIRNIFFQL